MHNFSPQCLLFGYQGAIGSCQGVTRWFLECCEWLLGCLRCVACSLQSVYLMEFLNCFQGVEGGCEVVAKLLTLVLCVVARLFMFGWFLGCCQAVSFVLCVVDGGFRWILGCQGIAKLFLGFCVQLTGVAKLFLGCCWWLLGHFQTVSPYLIEFPGGFQVVARALLAVSGVLCRLWELLNCLMGVVSGCQGIARLILWCEYLEFLDGPWGVVGGCQGIARLFLWCGVQFDRGLLDCLLGVVGGCWGVARRFAVFQEELMGVDRVTSCLDIRCCN